MDLATALPQSPQPRRSNGTALRAPRAGPLPVHPTSLRSAL